MPKFTLLSEEPSLDLNPTVDFKAFALKNCTTWYKMRKVIPISPNCGKKRHVKFEVLGVHRIFNKC